MFDSYFCTSTKMLPYYKKKRPADFWRSVMFLKMWTNVLQGFLFTQNCIYCTAPGRGPSSVHLVLSWARHIKSWERDNMSCPRDIISWERDIMS